MNPPLQRHSRRRLLGQAAAGAVLLAYGATPALAALSATPRQARGPFYPRALPSDRDNDLAAVRGQSQGPAGTITHVSGRIVDTNGDPVADALVEIWQVNGFGRYHHPGDRSSAPLDPGFQGYGQTITDGAGAYGFRTIRPVPYPGRTPHIHYAVTRPGSGGAFVTQMYIEGEPGNATDGILNRTRGAAALIVPLVAADAIEAGALMGSFDVVLPQ